MPDEIDALVDWQLTQAPELPTQTCGRCDTTWISAISECPTWRNFGLAKIDAWEVFEPDGTFSGAFDTWPEAMQWATSISTRLEYWLEHQR